MQSYPSYTGADLEIIQDAENTVRGKSATLHPDTGHVQGWEVLSKPSCTVRKILPGSHGCLQSGMCRTVHFLCFLFPIWQYSGLVEEFWLHLAEDPALWPFYDTHFLFTLIFILCSWLIQTLVSYLNVWEVFLICPMKHRNPISLEVLLVQHRGRKRGDFS